MYVQASTGTEPLHCADGAKESIATWSSARCVFR